MIAPSASLFLEAAYPATPPMSMKSESDGMYVYLSAAACAPTCTSPITGRRVIHNRPRQQ